MSTLARWARRFGLTRAICLLLLLALVPLRILDPAPLEEIRLRTFDFYQSLQPRETVSRPVVIVDIDEASLKDIGQWPWPRTIAKPLWRCLLVPTTSIRSSSARQTRMAGNTCRCASGSA